MPRAFPRVAVVVPARQEAAVIARSIASLVRQEYEGDFRVYIVDDHSSDSTVENAVLGAAGCPERQRVIPARGLPPDWSGKVWALSEGIAVAEAELAPDYILLTDADIVHPPENLTSLVSRAVAGGCILIRTRRLASIGGMASIRGKIIDDCALAAQVKQSGGRAQDS